MIDGYGQVFLNVSEIQHFSTGDGPGIRTTVFLKGCNLHCPWCHNPETVSPKPDRLVFKGNGKTVTYGRLLSAETVAKEVLEDREFYGKDGGLTLSGGEPMLQAESAAKLIELLAAKGVKTVIDTAASVDRERFLPLLGKVQCFLVDYKTGSDKIYEETIGGKRKTVIENIRFLIGSGESVRVRIPLIPGVNMSDADALEMCGQLKEAGVRIVDLLPFHRLGSAKYAAMNKTYAYAKTAPPDNEAVSRLREIFGNYFECFVE